MSVSNHKTWIVVGVLAVVIGGVAFLGDDFPPGSDQASGTIVPAERYRGEQISKSDVELGDESVSQLMQTDLVPTDRERCCICRRTEQRCIQEQWPVSAATAFRSAMASDSFPRCDEQRGVPLAMNSDTFRSR